MVNHGVESQRLAWLLARRVTCFRARVSVGQAGISGQEQGRARIHYTGVEFSERGRRCGWAPINKGTSKINRCDSPRGCEVIRVITVRSKAARSVSIRLSETVLLRDIPIWIANSTRAYVSCRLATAEWLIVHNQRDVIVHHDVAAAVGVGRDRGRGVRRATQVQCCAAKRNQIAECGA